MRVEATNGLLDITFTHEGGNGSGEVPILNSLTVDNAPAYVLRAPLDQSSYRVGDTMRVQWDANTYLVTGTDIFLSIDDGRSWHAANGDGTIFATDPRWGDCPIVVPASLGGVPAAGRQLIVKLSGYNSSYETEMPGSVSVLPGTSVQSPNSAAAAMQPRVTVLDKALVVSGIPAGAVSHLSVHDLDGSLRCRIRLTRPGTLPLSAVPHAAGAVVAVLETGGQRVVSRLTVR
jgi:hypothetical protein